MANICVCGLHLFCFVLHNDKRMIEPSTHYYYRYFITLLSLFYLIRELESMIMYIKMGRSFFFFFFLVCLFIANSDDEPRGVTCYEQAVTKLGAPGLSQRHGSVGPVVS